METEDVKWAKVVIEDEKERDMANLVDYADEQRRRIAEAISRDMTLDEAIFHARHGEI